MNMLMGNVTVSRDGSYSAVPAHLMLSYSTMLYGRIVISRSMAFQVAQVTTIAIRYSTVREQGVKKDGSDSAKIQSFSTNYSIFDCGRQSQSHMPPSLPRGSATRITRRFDYSKKAETTLCSLTCTVWLLG